MARTTRIQLIDDISGEHADENLRFALDGTDYEIDLAGENADELRSVLEKYVVAGRRLRGVPVKQSATATAAGREEVRRMRDWANANGYKVSSRGRISADIQQAFAAAHL
ncbi:Lsr2 family protein [Pseudarthrobacter sp. PS3-L1]|uniref:histone-like nucleoid-structuring protein Lsr2 n=1 Tax=Pseudarthrobacter sp. PS3-L1 TaxID=3046207 RepID=UPI0024BA0B31|nr:Lsr2 family protein [Pseudarthrobacter sp. PS3-L1]MDJ0318925.1 Lsr2 family protein [Pseudarthrobacter sp. PS3-L1]